MAPIRNTLICALVIAAIYCAAIQLWHPTFGKAPSTGLTNRLFVENYVYGDGAAAVVVGSSLSQRMPDTALGPDLTNLALSGGSALTGLTIAIRKPVAPRRIFIEINHIADPADETLLHQTFDEPAFTLRRHIAALRKSYQPLSVLYGVLRGKDREAPQPDLSDTQRADLIASTRKKLAQPFAADVIARRIQELDTLVSEAQRRGTQTVFFEMPIEPSLSQSAQVVQIRSAVRKAFPDACWLDLRLPEGAQTNDGVHLRLKDAAQAGEMFRSFSRCDPG